MSSDFSIDEVGITYIWKFAKAEPDSEQNENDYLKSYYFVEETKPVVEPAEGEKPDTELKKED